MTSNVSFTVRPPPRAFETDTPDPSRPGSASPSDLDSLPTGPSRSRGKRQWESYTADGSDEDEENTKEMITGFDAMGVQRSDGKSSKPAGPLIIPAQKNRDWHAESMARKRPHQMYIPDSAKVRTGADGSQGGLGTKGKINDGPQFSGLMVTKREEVEEDVKMEVVEVEIKEEVKEEEPMDEDQRALQALLRGEQGEERKREIAAISVEDQPGGWAQPKNEADAFKEDLETRPDEATLADYERIPIELFGEAMLRGMGMGSTKSKKSTQPYIPEARPALLGIGAKPRPVDELDQSKNKKFARPDKRYIPILKVERNGSGQVSWLTSRSRSGSPNRGSTRRDRDLDRRDRDRKDDQDRRDRDYDRDKRRDRDYDRDKRRDYESDRDKRRDHGDDKGGKRRDYDSDRDRRRDNDRDTRRDRDRDDRRDKDRRR
ncbi:pre-mrna-splicing factor spp2 [Rhizoctonia solani 123E]|uniref:Pre-mrna-splicing factor spp2 n=1 Tax=Rhizoctonia solani 123E TaxID=1423351 RepID=A0A074RK58_9AGAM|nr:pre-mrna-splicing factor spp2 [Rhizoctonia solani 123E]